MIGDQAGRINQLLGTAGAEKITASRLFYTADVNMCILMCG